VVDYNVIQVRVVYSSKAMVDTALLS